MLYPLLVSKKENARILDEIIRTNPDTVAAPRKLTADSWSIGDNLIRNLRNYPLITAFVLDLSSIREKDDELISMLHGLQLQRANARIVLYATEYSNGDELLDKFVREGFANIAAKDKAITDDKKQIEHLLCDLSECLSEDGLQKAKFAAYIIKKEPPAKPKEDNGNKNSSAVDSSDNESVLPKSLLYTDFSGYLNFVGAQSRIGTTRAALSSAYYFLKRGAKIAYVNPDVGALMRLCAAYADSKCNSKGSFEYNGLKFAADVDDVNGYSVVVVDNGCIDKDRAYAAGIVYLVAGIDVSEIEATRDAEYQLDGDNVSYQLLLNFTTEEQYLAVRDKMSNPNAEYHILPFIPDFRAENVPTIASYNDLYEKFSDAEEIEREEI